MHKKSQKLKREFASWFCDSCAFLRLLRSDPRYPRNPRFLRRTSTNLRTPPWRLLRSVAEPGGAQGVGQLCAQFLEDLIAGQIQFGRTIFG
jgi:hypothetical protein